VASLEPPVYVPGMAPELYAKLMMYYYDTFRLSTKIGEPEGLNVLMPGGSGKRRRRPRRRRSKSGSSSGSSGVSVSSLGSVDEQGMCYSRLVRDDRLDEVRVLLGANPTFGQILDIDRELLRDEFSGLYVQRVSPGMYHLGSCGYSAQVCLTSVVARAIAVGYEPRVGSVAGELVKTLGEARHVDKAPVLTDRLGDSSGPPAGWSVDRFQVGSTDVRWFDRVACRRVDVRVFEVSVVQLRSWMGLPPDAEVQVIVSDAQAKAALRSVWSPGFPCLTIAEAAGLTFVNVLLLLSARDQGSTMGTLEWVEALTRHTGAFGYVAESREPLGLLAACDWVFGGGEEFASFHYLGPALVQRASEAGWSAESCVEVLLKVKRRASTSSIGHYEYARSLLTAALFDGAVSLVKFPGLRPTDVDLFVREALSD
jgi:hypothetical protein